MWFLVVRPDPDFPSWLAPFRVSKVPVAQLGNASPGKVSGLAEVDDDRPLLTSSFRGLSPRRRSIPEPDDVKEQKKVPRVTL